MHSFWLANVTRPTLDKMLQDLRDNGNEVLKNKAETFTGECYTVEGSGVKAQVDYDPPTQRALVTIIDKPWLAPVSYIEQKVRESLRIALG